MHSEFKLASKGVNLVVPRGTRSRAQETDGAVVRGCQALVFFPMQRVLGPQETDGGSATLFDTIVAWRPEQKRH